MTYLYVHHKVEDYDQWRPVFDEMDSVRKAHGAQDALVFRDATNPNELIILTPFPDLDSARSYSEAPELREAMQRAGVTSRPDVMFLNEA